MSPADTALADWATLASAWAIFGIILLIIEITMDGSKVFFLPMGLGAMTTSLILYLQDNGVTPAALSFLTSWNRVLVVFVVTALIYAIIMRMVFRHERVDNTPDVNDY